MRTLNVSYSKLFKGLEEKPDCYQVLGDNYEWEKRSVDQHYKGRFYDGFHAYLDRVFGSESERVSRNNGRAARCNGVTPIT